MLVGDAARVSAFVVAFQLFGLTQAGARVAQAVANQLVDFAEYCPVVLLPEQVVVPAIIVKGQPHSASGSKARSVYSPRLMRASEAESRA